MKTSRILIFLSFLFSTTFSFAQDSTAISETGTWVVYKSWPEMQWDPQWNTYVPVEQKSWMMYKTGGDTLINGTSYKQLLSWSLSYNESTGEYSTGGAGFPVLAYRNSGDLRAYRVMFGTTTEELWYDFNLQVGDTIDAADQPAAFLPYTNYVYGIDSVEFCDSTYTRFTYTNNAGQAPGTGPMESVYTAAPRIGSLWNLIDENWVSDAWYMVTFFCESPTTVDDLYNLLGTKEEVLPKLSVYPNPASDVLFVKNLETEAPYVIIGMDGKTVLQGRTKDRIDVHLLSRGMYQLLLPDSGTHVRFVKK